MQFALERHRDIPQVADRHRPMADLNRRRGFSMGLHAINKVAMMIVASVKVDFVRVDHGGLQGLRMVRGFVPLNLNPTFCPLETERTSRLSFTNQLGAICIPGAEMHLRSGREQAVLWKLAAQIFYLDRSRIVRTVGPLDDIDCMRP